ncbi:glycerol kinase GlpK [Pseudogemmatithrix spongiicola]|uniref:glycerol kinase n=1 Tax=Pseudogemmatithrix spongiicola TaxID=3062599 RepID=A0AA49JSY3_9BACT|nr:glycerol kinase GlpK [Gemmatimonadaceae bacterium 'strain 138']WKW14269.1 glycerol kinase GlpK [Gemmatimonadaceae bacterium 'strain 318']
MRHVLALDEGTTGTTALVIAEDGRVVGRGYREITQHFPQPGWVEHDAEEIFARTVDAAREALAQAKVTPDALGITNQRETIVLWDRRTGKPVDKAIVWQDRRTTRRCAALREAGQAPAIYAATGLVTDPYFSATKLEWLLKERTRGMAPDTLAAGTIDTWLIWKLTNGAVHATDPTNASRTMLYDINTMEWSDQLCALFGVPREILPEVRPSSGSFGESAREHLGVALPILGVAGDQQSAMFGQGCWNPGQSKNTYGTGAFLLFNTGATRPPGGQGMLTTLTCDAAGRPVYALEASIFVAGAAVQWLRDGLGIVEKAHETEAMARSLERNDGVYFVPALTGLGAPHWEPEARGTIVGLTRGTSREHLVRAALEAMAYGTTDVLEAMRGASGAPLDVLRVDGGAAQNDWLMQFQADVLGVPVERPDLVETTALGAAGLAGIAGGVWPDAKAFHASRTFTRFAPTAGVNVARQGLGGWRRATRAAVSWARDRDDG